MMQFESEVIMVVRELGNLSDSEFEQFKTWVKGLLHDDKIDNLRITFTKADGSEREMRCTLVESAIPPDKVAKRTGRTITAAVQRVFDVDKQQWRSFKWDAVKRVQYDKN
jgi:hypothetical protein